jgi:hypothetical protein
VQVSTIRHRLPISARLNKNSPLDGEIHAYTSDRLGGARSLNTLQLDDIRGRTAAHGDPFDGRWLSVRLKMCCSRYQSCLVRKQNTHQFQRRLVVPFRLFTLPLSRWRRQTPVLKTQERTGRTLTQRYLNNQSSGNLVSSAFTSTANVQTCLICWCKARI